MFSLCPQPVFLIPRIFCSEVSSDQQKRKKKTSAFLLHTNEESLTIFNLTETFHHWNGEALLFERNTQSSPLPYCISGRENRNRQISFFIAKSLDGDSLLHIFCEEKDKNLSYLSLHAFVFHTKLIVL